MRSVPAAQSQLQNVSVRSHAEVIPASTPITVSVVPAVHDSAESLGVAIGSGRRAIVLAVCCSALLMFSGAAADRIGRRTIFQVGLSLFTLGSWLCSLAPSLSWLIAFRVLQGV